MTGRTRSCSSSASDLGRGHLGLDRGREHLRERPADQLVAALGLDLPAAPHGRVLLGDAQELEPDPLHLERPGQQLGAQLVWRLLAPQHRLDVGRALPHQLAASARSGGRRPRWHSARRSPLPGRATRAARSRRRTAPAPPGSHDAIAEGLAAEEELEVLEGAHAHRHARLGGGAAEVGEEHDVVHGRERLRHLRLPFVHVEPRAGDPLRRSASTSAASSTTSPRAVFIEERVAAASGQVAPGSSGAASPACAGQWSETKSASRSTSSSVSRGSAPSALATSAGGGNGSW